MQKQKLKPELKHKNNGLGNHGITLIALVVTIIVLLIIAGVAISTVFSENGLLERTKKTAFVSQMKKYMEEATMYVSGEQIENPDFTISVGLVGQDGIKKIIPKIKSDYEKEVIVQNNKTYYFYTNNKKRVKWCFEANIPVWSYDSWQDFVDKNGSDDSKDDDNKGQDSGDDGATDIGDKTPESTTYKKVGDVFMQTPDLSNMEPTSTYYITYDENGNQSIAGRIDRVDTPANWYDYSSSQKKYANIVTVTGNQVAYWVWIPRYSYITKSDQTVDARFISTTNEYKKEDGTTESLASNYQVPKAFTFANQELAGYWMSKYEISEISSPQIVINASVNIITISCDKIESGDYQVYIDGILKYTGSLPTQLTDLKENKKYDICIVKDGKILARTDVSTKSVVVDTSNLDPESTYYVTFDDNGENMQIGNRIDKGPAPDGWYDYSKKKYANIVTINNNEASYWVWIPRYKYKVEPDIKELSVQLITTSEKNHEGSLYEVPEAFTFNGRELPGYWISKYEISESSDDQEQVVINTDVQKITVSTNNVTENQNYKILVDGELKYTGTLPHDVEGVNPGQEYDICVIKDNIPIGRKKVSTKSIKVDLSNLDPINTYYVYWDDDGTEHNDTPISKPAPANWYDYSKKKWANIVTKANGKIAYWVWVPRYEYKINQSTKSIEINFISTDKVNNENSLYKVPEAFTFAGVELPGYWMSKYEISEPD